jgi:hypothetical protein
MTADINRDALAQRWRHSHEEDTDDLMVFRPEGYPFPPSRGRRSFELRPDGSLVGQAIGPDDRPVPTAGSWQLQGGNKLAVRATGVPGVVWQVESVSPEKLTVKKTPG